jgi:hypothetical protein
MQWISRANALETADASKGLIINIYKEDIMKKKGKKKPDVITTCPRCGEEYEFEKLEDLDELDIKTPCRKCGFMLHEHTLNKMQIVNELLMSGDQYAIKLIKKGKYEEFKKYLETKTGIKDPEPIMKKY